MCSLLIIIIIVTLNSTHDPIDIGHHIVFPETLCSLFGWEVSLEERGAIVGDILVSGHYYRIGGFLL